MEDHADGYMKPDEDFIIGDEDDEDLDDEDEDFYDDDDPFDGFDFPEPKPQPGGKWRFPT